MLLTGALCAVQSNKEFTVFVKWLPALAVLGVLYAYPAHAAESVGIPIRRVCQGTLVLRMIAATMTAMTINTLPDLARS